MSASSPVKELPQPVGQVATEPCLLHERNGPVARWTLNRPTQHNALSAALLRALDEALSAAAADRTLRVVVIAAAGRAFCAGHDLKELQSDRTPGAVEGLFTLCSRVMLKIAQLPVPVIAEVQGTATAAGCQLVAQCDLAVASEAARFAVSGINLGLFCSTPAVPLTRNIARKRAIEMLFTGDFIDAPTALAWGLVNQVVPPQALRSACEALTARLLSKPRDSLALGKALVYRQMEMGLAGAYQEASQTIACNFLDETAQEGVQAFIEKRAPNWPARP
jgi:enoyl-CoA hydratase/carnithine racemase